MVDPIHSGVIQLEFIFCIAIVTFRFDFWEYFLVLGCDGKGIISGIKGFEVRIILHVSQYLHDLFFLSHQLHPLLFCHIHTSSYLVKSIRVYFLFLRLPAPSVLPLFPCLLYSFIAIPPYFGGFIGDQVFQVIDTAIGLICFVLDFVTVSILFLFLLLHIVLLLFLLVQPPVSLNLVKRESSFYLAA